MRRIVAAVDFSEVTAQVVECAAALAERFGSELRLVHVAPGDPEFVGYEAGPQVVRDQVADELRDAHRALHELAEGLRRRGIDAKASLLRGPTAETIRGEVASMDADCVVVGSHGHGALHRALLGSVSEGVLHGATCPVLVVPSR